MKLGIVSQKLANALLDSLKDKPAPVISSKWNQVEYLIKAHKNIEKILGKLLLTFKRP